MDSGGTKYAAHIDVDANDSHALMIRMVGGGKRVLDVGCWTGDMGAALARFNPRVVGIEIDPEIAEQAKKVLDDVVVADVTELDFEMQFGPDAFDVIVFGDVLEHVTDPSLVLRHSLAAMAPNGFVVASIPNVAHGSVRISLLNGNFDYTPTGLLDETHLRFFTRTSVEGLFAGAGMAIVEMQRTIVDPVRALDRPIDEATVTPELLHELRDDLEAITYQFIVKAVRDDGAATVRALYEKAERLERELMAIRGRRVGDGPITDTGCVLRVGAWLGTTHLDGHHVRDALEQEIAARMRGPVDVRLLEGEVAMGPPGWGPDVVLWFDGDKPKPDHAHVRPVAVDPATVGLLAARHTGRVELTAHVDLLKATNRFPTADKVVAVVLAEEPRPLVEQLTAALSIDDTFDGAVVVAPTAADAARFEALWPGACLATSRPIEMAALVAVFAGSQAVVSASPFDRAVAASLGVRTAGTHNPEGVMIELDASMDGDEQRAEVVQALDRALDKALAGAQPLDDRRTDEVALLRDAVTTLQGRIAKERMLLADHVAELRVSTAAAETRELRANVAATSASLAAQTEALVQLQADYRAELERRLRSRLHHLPRRVRGRLRRSFLGKVKRRMSRLLRGS